MSGSGSASCSNDAMADGLSFIDHLNLHRSIHDDRNSAILLGSPTSSIKKPLNGDVNATQYASDTGVYIDRLVHGIEEMQQPVQRQSMRFELALYLYLIVHLLLQNYNIYRLVRIDIGVVVVVVVTSTVMHLLTALFEPSDRTCTTTTLYS